MLGFKRLEETSRMPEASVAAVRRFSFKAHCAAVGPTVVGLFAVGARAVPGESYLAANNGSIDCVNQASNSLASVFSPRPWLYGVLARVSTC